jgi:hypothetical protein
MDDAFSRIVGLGFATIMCLWMAYSFYRVAKTTEFSSKSDQSIPQGCLSWFGFRQASPVEMMWTFLGLGLIFLLALIFTLMRSI